MPPRPSSGPTSYWVPRAACRRAASPGPGWSLVTRGLQVKGRSSETGGGAAPPRALQNTLRPPSRQGVLRWDAFGTQRVALPAIPYPRQLERC